MHIYTETVAVSVSSSSLFAAALKTDRSMRSKQAFKSCFASLVHILTVLNTGLADLNFCLLVRMR